MKEKDENGKEVTSTDPERNNTYGSQSSQTPTPSFDEGSTDPPDTSAPSKEGDTPPPPEKPTLFDRLLTAMNRNKPASAFAIALIVIFIILVAMLQSNKVRHQRAVNSLVSQHEQLVDSLIHRNMELSARIFSWSVRSELLRRNTENLNQLFTVFVQETDATLVQLISVEDGTVTISTDKQFEGLPFGVTNLSELLTGKTVLDESGITVYTRVMGFNEPLGILVVRKKVN
jgi:hypothetical protein